MPAANPTLIVFDMDGTLLDSRAHIARAVHETARLTGQAAPDAAAIPRVIGLTLSEALSRLFPAAAAQRQIGDIEAVYRRVFAEWRATADHFEPLFDGTRDLVLDLAARGFLLGIATGKGRRGVDFVLGKHDLVGRFVTIQTPDTNPGKPDPAMLTSAMAETGIDPGRTIMVGDTTYDMIMARAAGVHALGVSMGNHDSAELRQSGAHAVIDHWSQFMHAVGRFLSV